MMVKRLVSAAAVLLLLTPTIRAQAPAPAPRPAQDDESGAAAKPPVATSLVGTWKARTERLPLTGDFNERVWGKNAASVRDVTLVVKAGGDATLTVARKVVDARGRTVPGSASLEEANVTNGDGKPGYATRVTHDVRVVKSERRYPDNPADRWPLDLTVNVVSFTDSRNTIEVRFEPADGQGAFSENLTKAAAGGARR
jgi:hypothetical protein